MKELKNAFDVNVNLLEVMELFEPHKMVLNTSVSFPLNPYIIKDKELARPSRVDDIVNADDFYYSRKQIQVALGKLMPDEEDLRMNRSIRDSILNRFGEGKIDIAEALDQLEELR